MQRRKGLLLRNSSDLRFYSARHHRAGRSDYPYSMDETAALIAVFFVSLHQSYKEYSELRL